MIETDTLALCECCALLIVNGDESGCRDYYGHTHQSANVPARTVLSDETDQPCHGFTCHGCGEPQAMFAYRLWAVVAGEQAHPRLRRRPRRLVVFRVLQRHRLLPADQPSLRRNRHGIGACRRGMAAHDLTSQATTERNTR